MAQGRKYEQQAHSLFKENAPPSVTVFPQAGGHGIDIEFQHKSFPNRIGIEVKRRRTDTMGNTSLRFNEGSLSNTPVKPINGFSTVFPEIQGRLTLPIQQYIHRVNELITEHNKLSPEKYKLISGFPDEIPVLIRKQCIKEGFQEKIQSFYNFDIESWKAFYRAKGNSYIQIGDKGLFHLGENPLNLPVPEILGSISLELRLYAAGSKGRPSSRVEIAIKFKGLVCEKSPYTLDNKNHITELFA
jgi:hypothetical protein